MISENRRIIYESCEQKNFFGETSNGCIESKNRYKTSNNNFFMRLKIQNPRRKRGIIILETVVHGEIIGLADDLRK